MALARMQGGARLFSLAELMREYSIGDLALFLGGLTSFCRDLSTSDQVNQPICTDAKLADLAATLEALMICCNNFEADPSLINQIVNLEQEILKQKVDRREIVLHARLKTILSAVEHNLDKRKFMYVPVDQSPYWSGFFRLGDEFLLTFPVGAKKESDEMGNCFAAGRWTACVFHSMRLAEYGLRKLAKSLKVRITDKEKICPIEFGDWNKIIVAIRSKLTKLRSFPAGPRKSEGLQFYSEAADHCEYMKDIWRNELAHTRRFYNKTEALSAMNRSSEFTLLLAKHYAQKEVKRVRKLRSSNAGNSQSSP